MNNALVEGRSDKLTYTIRGLPIDVNAAAAELKSSCEEHRQIPVKNENHIDKKVMYIRHHRLQNDHRSKMVQLSAPPNLVSEIEREVHRLLQVMKSKSNSYHHQTFVSLQEYIQRNTNTIFESHQSYADFDDRNLSIVVLGEGSEILADTRKKIKQGNVVQKTITSSDVDHRRRRMINQMKRKLAENEAANDGTLSHDTGNGNDDRGEGEGKDGDESFINGAKLLSYMCVHQRDTILINLKTQHKLRSVSFTKEVVEASSTPASSPSFPSGYGYERGGSSSSRGGRGRGGRGRRGGHTNN